MAWDSVLCTWGKAILGRVIKLWRILICWRIDAQMFAIQIISDPAILRFYPLVAPYASSVYFYAWCVVGIVASKAVSVGEWVGVLVERVINPAGSRVQVQITGSLAIFSGASFTVSVLVRGARVSCFIRIKVYGADDILPFFFHARRAIYFRRIPCAS